jgi:hypothetical protein
LGVVDILEEKGVCSLGLFWVEEVDFLSVLLFFFWLVGVNGGRSLTFLNHGLYSLDFRICFVDIGASFGYEIWRYLILVAMREDVPIGLDGLTGNDTGVRATVTFSR